MPIKSVKDVHHRIISCTVPQVSVTLNL